MKKTIAMIVATALVALTPVFAYADAGPKNEISITDAAIVTKADQMMTADKVDADNHGSVLSWANQNFQLLLTQLGIASEHPTRGQIISAIAKSDDGKSNEGQGDANADAKGTPTGTPEVEAASEKGNNGKGHGNEARNQGKGSGDDEGVTTLAATTPTATTTASATAVPTATATPEPTSTTPVPTSEERGRRGGNPNR